MEDYLYQEDLWWPLEGKTKKPITMLIEDQDILDKKALGSIQLSLAPLVAFNITKVKMVEELMENLVKLYEKPSTSNKEFLIKNLFNMKMAEGGSTVDHLNEFNIVTIQLSSMGINFDEEIRALLILFFAWKLE